MRTLIDKRKYAEALKLAKPYLSSENTKLLALNTEADQKKQDIDRKLKEKELRTTVAQVPASDWNRNRDLYAQLVKLNPGERGYRQKLKSYQGKIESEKERTGSFNIKNWGKTI